MIHVQSSESYTSKINFDYRAVIDIQILLMLRVMNVIHEAYRTTSIQHYNNKVFGVAQFEKW